MNLISTSIPATPQPWNRNPEGYVKHQLLLVELVTWLEEQGAEVQIPEDSGEWDKGVDLIINGLPVDLKGFGLQAHGSSYTWDSEFYRGRPRPLYAGSLTEWFVHPAGTSPSDWIAAPANSLRTSKYGYAPYYFQSESITMDQFVAS